MCHCDWVKKEALWVIAEQIESRQELQTEREHEEEEYESQNQEEQWREGDELAVL